jgi:hypothetical protein
MFDKSPIRLTCIAAPWLRRQAERSDAVTW